MSEIKINKLAKLIEIFDEMSANLNLGRLSNAEKDVLLSIGKQYSKNKNAEINIKNVNFIDYQGNKIAKSTLYKVLKNLCEKKVISHIGTERSSIYRLN
jgi:predicted transcriptional regulator